MEEVNAEMSELLKRVTSDKLQRAYIGGVEYVKANKSHSLVIYFLFFWKK